MNSPLKTQGTTQYFVLLSELPEYNDKIRAGFLMAPPVFMGNSPSPLFRLAPEAELLETLLHLLGKVVR